MRALLRNKKGLDYAAMMVLVVAICLIYLYIQLQTKVNAFPERIGESQIAVLNAYQKGEGALVYVDQAAKYSAYKALDTLAQRGGVQDDECDMIEEAGQKISIWAKKGKIVDDCLAKVQAYDAFNELMNGHLTIYSSKYDAVSLPANNYELFVQKDSITGTAVAPASVYLKPPTQVQEWFVGPLKVAEAELKKVAIGEYSFRPSFTIPIKTELGVYDKLKNEVRVFYSCTNSYSVDDCSKALSFPVVRGTDNPDYLVAKIKNPVNNPFGAMNDVVFALYAPEIKTSVA